MFQNIIVCPWQYGQSHPGVEQGAHDISHFAKLNFEYTDYKIIHGYERSNEDYHHSVYQNLRLLHGNKLLIGGDHSVAIGSVFSSLSDDANSCVIWIDAHADINTVDSSLSKNYHGMPLSFLCGMENQWKWTKHINKLQFSNLFYFGIRDIDSYELDVINNNRISILPDINAISNIIDNYNTVHISFDVDSLDPIDMFSTGTRSENGIPLHEITDLLHNVVSKQSSGKRINLDIVEYNPLIGDSMQRSTSWNTLEQLLHTLS